jgi:plasmid maintenance system antidote protein VapI
MAEKKKFKYIKGGIAEQLKGAISKSGMTHYALGKAANVSPAMIDRFIDGERDLRFSSADKLAGVLGMRLEA